MKMSWVELDRIVSEEIVRDDTPEPLLIAGRGVPWPGLWPTTPGTVPGAGEAALSPLS
jgi:hypothetical protein